MEIVVGVGEEGSFQSADREVLGFLGGYFVAFECSESLEDELV